MRILLMMWYYTIYNYYGDNTIADRIRPNIYNYGSNISNGKKTNDEN